MSDINTAIQTHPPTPEKSQSQFLWGKNRVCEHFSHNPVFWCFELRKINWRCATGDLDIPGRGPSYYYIDRASTRAILYALLWKYQSIYHLIFILKSNGIFSARNCPNVPHSSFQIQTEYFPGLFSRILNGIFSLGSLFVQFFITLYPQSLYIILYIREWKSSTVSSSTMN